MQKDQKPTYKQLRKVAQRIVVELKNLQKSPKWQNFSAKPCQMYKMEIDGNVASQGICVINFPLEKVVQFLFKVGTLKKLNPNCIEDRILYEDKDIKVNYMRYSAPWPISHRDFVSVTYKSIQSKEKVYLGSKSCNYPCPVVKKVVRGQILIGGYIVQRIDQKSTRVTYMSNADIKGLFPSFVKNQIAKNQGELAAIIERKLKKQIQHQI